MKYGHTERKKKLIYQLGNTWTDTTADCIAIVSTNINIFSTIHIDFCWFNGFSTHIVGNSSFEFLYWRKLDDYNKLKSLESTTSGQWAFHCSSSDNFPCNLKNTVNIKSIHFEPTVKIVEIFGGYFGVCLIDCVAYSERSWASKSWIIQVLHSKRIQKIIASFFEFGKNY